MDLRTLNGRKKGIYRNHDEFLNNAPSIGEDYEIKFRDPEIDVIWQLYLTGKVRPNLVRVYDPEREKEVLVKNKYWGTYNGLAIVLFENSVGYLVSFKGRFSTYVKNGWKLEGYFQSNGAIQEISRSVKETNKEMLIDLRTNKRYSHNVQGFLQLLYDYDMAVYKEFKALKKKKDYLDYYLSHINDLEQERLNQ